MNILSPECLRQCIAAAKIYGRVDVDEPTMARILVAAEAYRWRETHRERQHEKRREDVSRLAEIGWRRP